MAISYPLTLPTHTGIRAITIRARNLTALSSSPFTFKQQAISHAGQRWEAEVTLPPMKYEDAEVWIAWMMSLKGRVGTFTMGDPNRSTPRGSAGGTPLVNGADQSGTTLTIDGATASQTGWLKAGDYIQLGTGLHTMLHKVLTDADSDASGNVTLDVWPSMRCVPDDNDPVTVSGAKGLWRLTDDAHEWSVNEAAIYGLTFACVEAVL